MRLRWLSSLEYEFVRPAVMWRLCSVQLTIVVVLVVVVELYVRKLSSLPASVVLLNLVHEGISHHVT